MKTELITKMEELLLKDAGEVASDVRTLQKEYQKIWSSEVDQARQAYAAENGGTAGFEYTKQPDDLRFEELLERYNKQKKELEVRAAAEQAKNLMVRQEIIAKIKDLSTLSDNVGVAVKMLGELQKQWKETGPVSPHKYKEIQSDYSRAVEDIYYNIKIFRDLQEHDLKKNYELKSTIIEKVRGIQSLDNIKEAERLIKFYRNEWEEIGPVPHMKWEALKTEYKGALDETYAKIKSHYHSIEEQKEHNLKAKQEIIDRARELVAGFDESKTSKWNEVTDKLIALQGEWKTAGRTSEKDNEKIWAEFRAVCDSFFERKKEYFSGLNEKFAANRKIKTELIARAEGLQHSNDWQKTGAELMRLQDTWKKYPSGGDKEEPRLFSRFRKACNTFFDARKKHFEDLDASFEQNLAVKEEILSRFNTFQLGDDNQANREQLRQFGHEWNAAGLVPMKDKKRLNDAFYNRLDELYDQMQIDKQEKAAIQFRTKIDRMAGSENGVEQLRKESDHLRKMIDEITARIRTYDNNLGFFKTSKGSNNTFMKEIEEKIGAEKSRIAELNAKRKLINEELNRMREAEKPKTEA